MVIAWAAKDDEGQRLLDAEREGEEDRDPIG
jgi:hypothetical protein